MKLSQKNDLLKEWDYEKNNLIGLFPDKLLHKSNKKAWWKCSYGHSWQMEIYRRTDGRTCPFCANKRVLIGFNDLTTLYPEIAKEWHPEKNIGLNISDFVIGSAKKVWWRCKTCGFEWQARINHRTKRNSSCPECAKIQRGQTQRKTKLKKSSPLNKPELLAEWDYEKNDDSPQNYSTNSNKYAWWKCKTCSFEWRTRISHRTKRNSGCPCCANKVAVAGVNDLATTHPELAKEWHPVKNGNLSPQQVLAGSAKKIWWICPQGHEYQASLLHRGHGTNCPICNSGRQTSFAEQAFFYYIKQIFPDAESRVPGIIGRRMELDIYIPSQKIAIEYDGEFWHKTDDFERENFKYQECLRLGIKLHRIKEGDLAAVNRTADVSWHMNNLADKDQLSMMIRHLLDEIDPRSNKWTMKNIFRPHSPVDVDVKRDEFKIRRQYTQKLKRDSLAKRHPVLTNDWDYEKNNGLTPEMFKPGSSQKVWWICKICGHSWEADIYSRAKNNTGCPVCYRQKNKGGNHHGAKKIFQYSKDWQLIKEWDCISEASRALQINSSNISMCAKHIRAFAGGYRWEYTNTGKRVSVQLNLFES